MERKLTVVADIGADSVVLRNVVTATAIVGMALLLGCSTNRCHRCCSSQTATCQNRVCSPTTANEPSCQAAADWYPTTTPCEEATESPAEPEQPVVTEEETVATKPVVRPAPIVKAKEFDVPMYGHGKNYEWLIGVLHRVHIPRKGWKVRYAPLDQQDRWGGSVVVAPDARVDDFDDGTVVYVEGDVINDRASLYLTGPRYRVKSIRRANESDKQRLSHQH